VTGGTDAYFAMTGVLVGDASCPLNSVLRACGVESLGVGRRVSADGRTAVDPIAVAVGSEGPDMTHPLVELARVRGWFAEPAHPRRPLCDGGLDERGRRDSSKSCRSTRARCMSPAVVPVASGMRPAISHVRSDLPRLVPDVS
jgi:hypothetical protein